MLSTISLPNLGSTIAFGALALLLLLIQQTFKRYKASKALLPLPPSPSRGNIIAGHLPMVLSAAKEHRQHLLFQKWAEQYGEVFFVQLAASQTSERPRWIVSNEHICNKLNVLLLSASEKTWKNQRKAATLGLTSLTNADTGLPFLHFESLKFLNDIAQHPSKGANPQAVYSSIGRYTYSTFASQIFGLDVPDDSSPAIHYIFETGIAQILGILPGYYLVDTFTFLDKLPLFLKPWERDGRARFKRDYEWSRDKLERVKALIAAGEAPPHMTFLRRVIDDPNHLGLDSVEDAAYLGLMLIIGASDTIMKESWRWRPPVALGHPHMTTRDVVYEGHRIPKGARIHLNAWAIHRDPKRYPEPEKFIPERFEGDVTSSQESAASPDVSKRDHFAFGAGRRICPGYHVADRSFAISIMRILWAFDITLKPGTKLPLNPQDFPGEMPGNPGLDLPVVLTVRSPERRAMIQKAYKEAVQHRPKMEPLVI
ncbi:hypothetical protein FSPOR_10791 [Fusarium sporotrichioides]|uniref:Cytochrome p450 n=1 Tax=Fusarium sporotrichioides TaxID=5514 RepID=A0A395RJZ5_FUSSP|nr:hypothetical protein FSPOR_10791 [Fusarium sporotrichioides]